MGSQIHKQKVTKLGSQKLHICPKVTNMGFTIGHRIDYNGASGTYAAKINPSNPPGGTALSLKS